MSPHPVRARFPSLLLALALALAPACRRHERAPEPLPRTPAPYACPPVLPGTPNVPALVQRVRPAVVNITAIHEIRVPRHGPGWLFGGPGAGDGLLKEGSLGSGFVLDEDGHVVTNAHVIEQADLVRVKLADQREFRARTIARDPLVDVAVLKLEDAPPDLPVASLGSSASLQVGEYVVAIGNPFGLGDTVTMGIVSATGRTIGAGPYDDFVQTDASINPGNSGGPLFDLNGQVVGINTAIEAQGKGIGFAIPIDEVKRELPQLIATGHVARGRLGVTVQSIDQDLARSLGLDRPRGALVVEVEPGGPAAKAGLQRGDVVLEVDGTPVAQASDLTRIVADHAPGSRVRLAVERDGRERRLEATLGSAEPRGGVASMQPPGPPGAPSAAPGAPPALLGIAVGDAPGGGALVESVTPLGPADGKLQPGDVVVELNRAPVSDARELAERTRAAPTSHPVMLLVRHDHRSRFVAIERPAAR